MKQLTLQEAMSDIGSLNKSDRDKRKSGEGSSREPTEFVETTTEQAKHLARNRRKRAKAKEKKQQRSQQRSQQQQQEEQPPQSQPLSKRYGVDESTPRLSIRSPGSTREKSRRVKTHFDRLQATAENFVEDSESPRLSRDTLQVMSGIARQEKLAQQVQPHQERLRKVRATMGCYWGEKSLCR